MPASNRQENDCRPSTLPDGGWPWEYVCINRPSADIESENWAMHSRSLNPAEMKSMYAKGFEECRDRRAFGKRASEHTDWKWVIMNESWLRYWIWQTRADNCDPFKFGLNVEYNCGLGMLEIIENFMIEFDERIKLCLYENVSCALTWSVIASFGLWLVEAETWENDIQPKDAARRDDLIALIGSALLTALDIVEYDGKFKPNSEVLDLPLVISYFLEFALGLDESAGIFENSAVDWRPYAVAYFRMAELDPSKGLCGTAKLLDRFWQVEKTLKEEIKEDIKEIIKEEIEEEAEEDQENIVEEPRPDGWLYRVKKIFDSCFRRGGEHISDDEGDITSDEGGITSDERDITSDEKDVTSDKEDVKGSPSDRISPKHLFRCPKEDEDGVTENTTSVAETPDDDRRKSSIVRILELPRKKNEGEKGGGIPKSVVDTWSWSKSFACYRQRYGNPEVGGMKHVISEWTSDKRNGLGKKAPIQSRGPSPCCESLHWTEIMLRDFESILSLRLQETNGMET